MPASPTVALPVVFVPAPVTLVEGAGCIVDVLLSGMVPVALQGGREVVLPEGVVAFVQAVALDVVLAICCRATEVQIRDLFNKRLRSRCVDQRRSRRYTNPNHNPDH